MKGDWSGMMKTTLGAFLAAFLACASAASAQVDQKAIDAAIRRGIEWLKTAPSPPHEHSKAEHSDELILWTFIHAGVPASQPRYKQMLERILSEEPHQTYKVALQAMCLEEIDRVKYQNRIAHCAQHLLDNQCSNGQWSYGSPTPAPKDLPPMVASGGPEPRRGAVREFGAEREKPKVVRKLMIKRQRDGGAAGDNSNSQYAALGLRACFEAGITFPEDAVYLAIRWWAEAAHAAEGKGKNDVASGGYGVPQGWAYKGAGDGEAYGSMSAGAVGALVIYDYMLKKDWKKNTLVKNGLAWMDAHYSVKDNPGKGGSWHYYYLYGLERAAILYDTNMIGKHDWYLDGARLLLAAQKPDGSWNGGTWDSCFAILFLKKATRPLVASGPGR
jgi:hypothetical protein